jgi:hypothetical protein
VETLLLMVLAASVITFLAVLTWGQMQIIERSENTIIITGAIDFALVS